MEKLVSVLLLALALVIGAIIVPTYRLIFDFAAIACVIATFVVIIRGLPEPAPIKKDPKS